MLMSLPEAVVATTRDNIAYLRTFLEVAADVISHAKSRKSPDGRSFSSPEEFEEELGSFNLTFNNEQLLHSAEYSAMERFTCYAHTMTAFSIFEFGVRGTCDALHLGQEYPLSVADLRGDSEMARANRYLKSFAGIALDKYPEWNALHDLRKLRNCIAHGNGRVSTPSRLRKLENIKKQHSDAVDLANALWGGGQILIVRSRYCERYPDLLDSFFTRLFAEAKFRTQVEIHDS